MPGILSTRHYVVTEIDRGPALTALADYSVLDRVSLKSVGLEVGGPWRPKDMFRVTVTIGETREHCHQRESTTPALNGLLY